jgi:hypothetical protein
MYRQREAHDMSDRSGNRRRRFPHPMVYHKNGKETKETRKKQPGKPGTRREFALSSLNVSDASSAF